MVYFKNDTYSVFLKKILMKGIIMKKVFVLLCFIVFVIFSSCEIGLGAQVDVEPPSVSLLSPNENARTRKTITFSGEWNDDLEVKEVSVLFKKTNDEKVQLVLIMQFFLILKRMIRLAVCGNVL